MTTNLYTFIASDDHADCFGDYNKKATICTKHCVLRLSCAIEQGQNLRTALLEELVASEEAFLKIQ